MNKFQLSAVVAGISLATGVYFANPESNKNLALTVGIGSGGLLLGVGGTMFVTKKVNERKFKLLAEDKGKLEQTKTDLETNSKIFSNKANRFEAEVKQLTNKLSEATTQLALIKSQKQTTDYQNIEHVKSLTKLQETNRHLITELEKVQETIKNKDARISELNTELEEGWGEQVTTEAEKIFKQRAEKAIIEEIKFDKSIAEEAMELCREYMQIAEEMFEDNEQHHQEAMTVNSKAKEVITNLKQAEIQALGDKEDYIRSLQLKIDDLNSQLNGEILQPEKTKGAIGRHWMVANHLIEHMGELGINLKITGVEECGENDVIAFAYSKSTVPTKICEVLNQHGKVWAKTHGVHFIGNARLSKRFPAIEVTLIVDRPRTETNDAVYKAGLVPSKLFGETIHKALNPKKGGRPTLRVMGATGDGKGISLKNYLNYLTNQDNDTWELWLSDPVDGLSEDYWDCDKVATDAKTASIAFKNFASLHDIREKGKIDGFTDKPVIGLFDEFDRNHSEQQHEEALRIMVSLRHSKMRQILVGQCAEVGKNGWTWGDMTNCSLFAVESSIGILKKHLRPDMGWTLPQVKKLEKDYNLFSKWRDQQREDNPDYPDENKARLGLLIIGDKYQFLELPMAYKGLINSTSAVTIRQNFETFEKTEKIKTAYLEKSIINNTQINAKSKGNKTSSIDLEIPLYCPKCGSKTITEVEPYKDGRRRFKCGKSHKFGVQANQVRNE